MRIISQNLVSFPFERIIVEVDDNSIMCRLCAVPEKRYYLGRYKDCERAKGVFKEIDFADFRNEKCFKMPEE